jgi:hypothetical protein
MNKTPSEPVKPSARPSALTETIGWLATSPSSDGATDIPQRIGDFTIVRVLGEGGMGPVTWPRTFASGARRRSRP